MNIAGKKLVTQSLKSLTLQRFKEMCRLRALRQERGFMDKDEEKIKQRLRSIQAKINWEVNKYNDILNP